MDAANSNVPSDDQNKAAGLPWIKSDENPDSPWGEAEESWGEEMQAAIKEGAARRLQIVAKERVSEDFIEQARLELDIVERAKILFSRQMLHYPDEQQKGSGQNAYTVTLTTEANRFVFFDAMFGGDRRPHLNTFKGRVVDEAGDIIDDRYSAVDLVNALTAGQIKGCNAEVARKSLREWAMKVKYNDLIKRLEGSIPEWDGVPRIEGQLIGLFKCSETPLNRDFSKYFWLSIYCRIMYPGCYAPMVLSLFGAQDSGKSFFAKTICEEIMDDKNADSVPLDLSGDKMEFLRQITGESIIANVGEMTGFSRGDLNKIKDFTTRTGDGMHYKYEGNFTQPRQWIVVMDGNKYEGLQRDETGNRRFYPMFVGQLPDKDGQPDFVRTGYSVDFTGFREEIWQLLAECRAWVAENGGVEGYIAFARGVSKGVQEFSRNEMENDRGTVHDPDMEDVFPWAIERCFKSYYVSRTEGGLSGVLIYTRNFKQEWNKLCKAAPNLRHLATKMTAIGGVKGTFSGGKLGFIFPDYKTVEEMEAANGWDSELRCKVDPGGKKGEEEGF